jgi:hypothetical protein
MRHALQLNCSFWQALPEREHCRVQKKVPDGKVNTDNRVCETACTKEFCFSTFLKSSMAPALLLRAARALPRLRTEGHDSSPSCKK